VQALALDYEVSWRRAMPLAGLVSIALHTALLTLPLGTLGSPREGSASPPRSVLTASITAAAPRAATPVPQPVRTEMPAQAPLALAASPPLPYFKLSQLSEAPRALAEPPLELLQSIVKQAGAVNLRLFIDEAGNVAQIDVESASLPAEATMRAVAIFSHMRFTPGKIGRFSVKSQIPVTVGAVRQRSYDSQ
jgi:hypothetical protein